MKIVDYLKAQSAREIKIGQSGAKVWETEGQYVVKYVCRKYIKNAEIFEAYKKEARFYKEMAGREYLPEILQIEMTGDEIWIWMKKYNMIESHQLDDSLLQKVTATLARVHTDSIPDFLLKESKKAEALSEETIQACYNGWDSVLSEHPGMFDVSAIKSIAEKINKIILWYDSTKKVLCHGDFHRENLLLDEEENIRICDWQGVSVGSMAGDISFFMSRLGAEGIILSEDKVIDFYTGAIHKLTGERISNEEMHGFESTANLITSFIFWHEYLHGSEKERVRGIYEKMIQDFTLVSQRFRF